VNTAAPKTRHPILWVPSLYLAMGLPNVTVSVVAAIMYKNLGISNAEIALYTSQMYLPWVLKPIWAPLLEPFRTKRFWVLSMEFTMAAILGLVAFSLPLPRFFAMSLAFFWVAGFASATQDIVADAVYLTTLPAREQARYMGVQGMCWNLGRVLASGALVSATGILHDRMGFDWAKSWMVIMCSIGGMMALLGAWHVRVLPQGALSPLHGQGLRDAVRALDETWVTFFQKKHIWMMLVVVFFYRFGEGFIEKFGALFLLDSRAVGGLGLTNETLGHIYGTAGTIAFIAGTLLGGLFAAKMTLRRSFLVLAFALNVPHVTFFYLSHALPESLTWIGAVVALEKFGYGVGSVGHMLYMMQQIAPGRFQMAHYAFATGVMAMTMWVTGTISGPLFTFMGGNYPHFFLFVLLASIPPIVFAWLAPFPHDPDRAPQEATESVGGSA
jgi:MFS transporter, PAT family, beta-lactamase induction signal transducer AmpG